MWKILTAQITVYYYYSVLLFTHKSRTVPRGTERMPQGNQKNRRSTIHWSSHPQGKQNVAKKSWINNKKAFDMVPQSWIINRFKMYKISLEIYWKYHGKLESRTDTGRKKLKAKIQRGIFREDALLPLLFVMAMMSFNLILRKYTGGYKLHKSQEKINH